MADLHPDLPPDLNRAMVALLDRAADGDVADPPVADLLHRGARARARRRLAAAGGVAAVAAATAGILVATLVLPSGSRAPAPRPAQPQPRPTTALPAGPTATQWAHGSWHDIAKAPINTCSAADAAWGGGYLMVVAQNCEQLGVTVGTTAALYDPRHDEWTKLPAPALTWPVDVVWTGREWVAVSLYRGPGADSGQVRAATWDIRPGRSTVITDTGWHNLSPIDELPPLFTEASVAAAAGNVVVAGLGPDGDLAYRLTDAGWEPLPRLPHEPRHTLPAVAVGSLDGTVYAIVTDQITRHRGNGVSISTRDEVRMLRLDGERWREVDLPRGGDLPAVANRVAQFGDHLLVVGSYCPPFASCPASGAAMALVDADGRARTMEDNPLSLAATDAVAAGRALVSYDAYTRFSGAGGVRPGDSAVWDPDKGRWRRGPSSVPVNDVATIASTPYGVVVLGRPATKCGCDPAGLILRPARR